MAQKISAPIIALVVLIIISLSLAGSGFYLFQKERAKNIELQGKIDEVSAKQKITETQLKESEKLVSELQFKLQDSKAQVETLNNSLKEEKAAKQDALDKAGQLKADLEKQKGLQADLEKKLSQAQGDVNKAQSQLKELDAKKADLEAKLKALEAKSQGVELGTIVVSPSGSAPAAEAKDKKAQAPAAEGKAGASGLAAALEGKVLVVNKEYNFAVINLGNKDGIKLDDVFAVYHENKHIGDIKVEKVHDSMAAAGFLAEGTKDKISEGDRVVQKS